MPPLYTEKTIRTGIHDFKTNIAKYIRLLDSGRYEQLILTARGRAIGGFYTFEGTQVRKQQARLRELSGLLSGSDPALSGLLSGSVDKSSKE